TALVSALELELGGPAQRRGLFGLVIEHRFEVGERVRFAPHAEQRGRDLQVNAWLTLGDRRSELRERLAVFDQCGGRFPGGYQRVGARLAVLGRGRWGAQRRGRQALHARSQRYEKLKRRGRGEELRVGNLREQRFFAAHRREQRIGREADRARVP